MNFEVLNNFMISANLLTWETQFIGGIRLVYLVLHNFHVSLSYGYFKNSNLKIYISGTAGPIGKNLGSFERVSYVYLDDLIKRCNTLTR